MVPNPKMQKTCPNNEPIRIRAPIKHLRHYIFRMLKTFAFVLVTIAVAFAVRICFALLL